MVSVPMEEHSMLKVLFLLVLLSEFWLGGVAKSALFVDWRNAFSNTPVGLFSTPYGTTMCFLRFIIFHRVLHRRDLPVHDIHGEEIVCNRSHNTVL